MVLFLLVAALGGCTGGGNTSNPDGNVGDTSNPSTTPDGTATLTYTVSVLESEEDCQINVSCSDDDVFSLPSGESVEIDAPNTCEITAGLDGIGDFEFPVHVGNDGEYWAAPPLSVSVVDGDKLTGKFTTFNLFAPGYYACEYDEYTLDTSQTGLRGEFIWTEVVDDQFISVDQLGVIHPEDNPNMDVIGSTKDQMVVIDDQINLVKEDDGAKYSITESEIGNDSFSVTVVDYDFGYIAYVSCNRDE